ncbi:MAG TPA: patatin-like phospholipase family protein [Bdellovibrionota bacterium]|jgi:NTE family protein
MNHRNRALVLTGGGARGAYQAGVLKYIAENFPEARFETLVGSSSGAINVAGLASFGGGVAEAGPYVASLWSQLEMNQVFRTDFLSLAGIGLRWLYDVTFGGLVGRPAAHYLVDTRPLRKLLTRIYRPEGVREALAAGKLKNVAVSATEVYTGNLVTFVQSLSCRPWHRARRHAVCTDITVDHILASAAIPLLFPSVLVGNRQYVDGCIRSTSPLGPATRLGAEKILAVGVRRFYMRESGNFSDAPLATKERQPSAAQLGALVLNSLFAEALDADVEHLERLNSMVPDSRGGSFGMRKIDVMVIRPSEDLGELATHYFRLVPPFIRFLLRGLGSEEGDSSDVLSYLLFVPEFLQKLVSLGYNDARAEHDRLKRFLVD